MSNEISYNISGTVTNGSFTDSFSFNGIQMDQTGQGANAGIWFVGTSEEDLGTTDITNKGLFVVTNCDATNFVTLGPKSSGSMVNFLKIPAGKSYVMYLDPAVTIRAKADTAQVKLAYKLLEA